MPLVLTLFGTRPEIIKLAPVIRALERRAPRLASVNVCSSQHTDLLRPFVQELAVRIDHDLAAATPGSGLCDVLSRVATGMTRVIEEVKPDMVLVQGDTTTAVAGALAASYSRIAIGHVEAGLRTGDRHSPFPEETNRRLISQLADLHFAATSGNVDTLLSEGIDPASIVLTGNPVVDSLLDIVHRSRPSAALARVLAGTSGKRLLVLTMHRRENAGSIMADHLQALRRFIARHPDVVAVFPVHPNPAVQAAARDQLDGAARIHAIAPLEYGDFVQLLSHAWLIASDSGGIQEEAPSLGKPVLVLRDTTERPEVLACGIGRLVGHSGEQFEQMLEQAHSDPTWAEMARSIPNPFGSGDAGERIAAAVEEHLMAEGCEPAATALETTGDGE